MARSKKTIKELLEILTPREKLYAEKYIESNYNASEAARAVALKGQSVQKTIRAMANKPVVKEYIELLKFELFSTIDVSTERIVQELAKIAFSDIRDLYDDNGRLLSPRELQDRVAGAISQVESTEIMGREGGQTTLVGFNKKVRMHDKLKALEMIGKLAGLELGDEKVQQISIIVQHPSKEEE